MTEAAQHITADQPCLPPHADTPATSTMRVWGTLLLLALLGGLGWVIAAQRTRTVDASQSLSSWFDVHALPFGLEAVEAAVLPRGDEMVRLAQRDAPAEAAKNVVAPPKPGEKRERVDWSKVPAGPEGTPPVEVVITRLPLAVAKSELTALFREGQDLRGDLKSVGDQGGRRIVDRGQLAWGTFAADYAYEREFEPGLTFRDVMRVNLSREGAPCVLLARWPRNVPASRPRVEELLAALPPRQ